MVGSLYDGASGSYLMMPSELLSHHDCAVCCQGYDPTSCDSCKAVHDAIKHSQQTFHSALFNLGCQSYNIFRTSAGHFWGLPETRDYMQARFDAANTILKISSLHTVEIALDHFTDMLRLNRSDNLGAREIIPHLLLRLGREQECYDFLKWWAIVQKQGRCDFGDLTLPYMDIHGADAFESVDMFCSKFPNLSHLVALALLKLRLYLDLAAYEDEDDFFGTPAFNRDAHPDRSIGKIVREKTRSMDQRGYVEKLEDIKRQYRRLFQAVHDANPYFWELLVAEEATSPPASFTYGSKEEAELVIHQCQRAWQESEDAIATADDETGEFTVVYQGPSSTNGIHHPSSEGSKTTKDVWERNRGTGKALPSRFSTPAATASPAWLFPETITDHNKSIRFIHRHDQQRILVYVDGACSNNGQPGSRAGWAVVFGKPHGQQKKENHVVSGRLESKGPFGDHSVATSNRAELRAVIAALRLCDWKVAGYNKLVIATDSSYVVDGATGWVKSWIRNGWVTRIGDKVKNKDLWELLLGEVDRWKERGLHIDLWKIPRESNGEAGAAAKNAAHTGTIEAEFKDISIVPSRHAASRARPRMSVLALCLKYKSSREGCSENHVHFITSRTKIERATTEETALAVLTQHPSPSVILICDAAIARKRKLWECVIDRLREGATVVFTGLFSSTVTTSQFARLFAKVGLPWRRGSYDTTTVSMSHRAADFLVDGPLPADYSAEAVFVKNIDKSVAWYTENETSDEAAVVMAKVGRGRLGYIGDVKRGQASSLILLTMCRLSDPPVISTEKEVGYTRMYVGGVLLGVH